MTKANNGWINDKLPPESKEVLAFLENTSFYYLAFYRNGTWYRSDDGEKILLKVSHWQPLPQPPEE